MNDALLLSNDRKRGGFTLLESLIVLAIIAIVLTLTVTAVQRVRHAAACAACAHNMRQLALAVHQFEAIHHKLPEGCGYPFLTSFADFKHQGGISWQTAILPFIDQQPLWEEAWRAQQRDPSTREDPLHAVVRETIIPLFLCPTEPLATGYNAGNGWHWGLTSYLGVAGTDRRLDDGVFHKNLTVHFMDISDGSSNTLMIGERPAGPKGQYAAWYASWGDCVCAVNQILHAGEGRSSPLKSCDDWAGTFRPGTPGDICDVNHFWSLHSGGANFAFADGSVRFLTYSSQQIIPALATRAGNEPVSLD